MSLQRWSIVALVIGACGPDASQVANDVAATAETDVTRDATPETAPEVPPWQHVGPITTTAIGAPPTPLFVTRKPGLPEGVAIPETRSMIVDFDGDGWDDLVAIGTTSTAPALNTPRFLRNRGDWTFEDVTAESGMADAEMVLLVFGDIDNDGDQDAFAGTSFRSPSGTPGIWLNDGTGHFEYLGADGLAPFKISSSIWKEMAAATLVDLDGDGRLDLYLGTFRSGAADGGQYMPPGNELYRSDAVDVWQEVELPDQHNPLTSEVEPSEKGDLRATYGVCPADFDDDGDMDIFVNNYGAGRPALDDPPHFSEWNFLWRNDGDMKVVDVSLESQVHATKRGIGGVQEEKPVVFKGKTYPGPVGGNGFSCAWGDIDNDGDLDLAVGQIAHPDYPQSDRLLLHINPGGAPGSARVFEEASAEKGLIYNEDELFPVLVDIDQDGRLDLVVSRLRRSTTMRDPWDGKLLVYLQKADRAFDARSIADAGPDIDRPGPTVWLDADHDGDLDFFMARAGGQLFENQAATGGHLIIRLVGAGKSPRDATGTRVTLTTSVGKQMRELTSGSGHYNTQNTRELHFGLGGDSGAKDVTIRWPDGELQKLGDVKANLRLEVIQGGDIRIVE